MKALILGLFTVFKHLFMKPVTLEYPEKTRELNNNFRGKLIVNGCVGCGICKKVCPSGAIDYQKDENGKVVLYKFDLKKCIFCGNCMYYCPQKAIKMTKIFELASEEKEDLQLEYKKGVQIDK
jgi:NADH-quinone oxidoreductase subunit I